MRLHPCTLENVRKKNDLIVFSLFDIALQQQTNSAVANKIIHQQSLLETAKIYPQMEAICHLCAPDISVSSHPADLTSR
jgi:hypothetical protein